MGNRALPLVPQVDGKPGAPPAGEDGGREVQYGGLWVGEITDGEGEGQSGGIGVHDQIETADAVLFGLGRFRSFGSLPARIGE
jgi:hypothetical protein